MREIKFRAWSKETSIMFYDLQNLYDGMGVSPAEPDQPIYNASFGTQSFGDVLRSGAPVMQFTGLKDKNGKEIYEGDVAELQVRNEYGSFEKRLAVMEFVEGCFKFGFEAVHGIEEFDNVVGVKVIGNIYENPELLSPPKETGI